jgi:hypothetical protein
MIAAKKAPTVTVANSGGGMRFNHVTRQAYRVDGMLSIHSFIINEQLQQIYVISTHMSHSGADVCIHKIGPAHAKIQGYTAPAKAATSSPAAPTTSAPSSGSGGRPKFCGECGTPTGAGKFCTSCGAAIPA